MVEGHQALLTQPGVDQGALADVGGGRPRPGGSAGRRRPAFGPCPRRPGEIRERRLQQAADALAVRRRHRVRLADAQFMELGQQRRLHHALGLVDRQQHLLALAVRR
jgi:hypothetical protein